MNNMPTVIEIPLVGVRKRLDPSKIIGNPEIGVKPHAQLEMR